MFNNWNAGLFVLNAPFLNSILTGLNSLDLLLNHLLGPNVSVHDLSYVGDNNVHHQVTYVS